jgi:hypothetical protein
MKTLTNTGQVILTWQLIDLKSGARRDEFPFLILEICFAKRLPGGNLLSVLVATAFREYFQT